MIYYPFFKMYEKVCVEKEKAQNLDEKAQQELLEKARMAAQ
ncbi:hypothetical protein [Mannheimia haemolytica]|nr:hypothetical protein [Mannheimia haemolytica]